MSSTRIRSGFPTPCTNRSFSYAPGPHQLGDPRPSGDAAHDPTGRVAVDPPPVSSNDDRSLATFAHRQVDGPGRAGRQRDGHDLATLAHDRERAVPSLQPQVLDVSPNGFRDPQPVESQQAEQGVIPGAGQPRSHQHGADLVAVQAGGVGLVVQLGAPHVGRWRDPDQAFLFGVRLEAGHCAQPAGDRGPGPT